MIEPLAGDPASCSELGGTLRSHSARLLAQRQDLAERLSGVRSRRLDPALVARFEADQRLLDEVIDRVDEAGAALQRYAQELAQVAEARRRLERAVGAADLRLDGFRVVEPWGVLTAELAERRQQMLPELQQWSDRLASQLGRARGILQRTMRDATASLSGAAATGRAGLGR